MRKFVRSIALLVLAAPVFGQVVTEIPAMTANHSVIDMDALPLGPVTVSQLNAAGTNGGATLTAVSMSASSSTFPGDYNSFVCGQALAAEAGSNGTVPAIVHGLGSAAFDPMVVTVEFRLPVTEFGLSIGDWAQGAVLDFYSGGALVASYSTSRFNVLCEEQFYQMTGGTFDRVDIDMPTSTANFVITQLVVEEPVFEISVTPLIVGQSPTYSATYATPFRQVFLAWDTDPGPTTFGIAICGGALFDFDVGPSFKYAFVTADAQGMVSLTLSSAIPASALGVQFWFQGFDAATCTKSNSVTETVM